MRHIDPIEKIFRDGLGAMIMIAFGIGIAAGAVVIGVIFGAGKLFAWW